MDISQFINHPEEVYAAVPHTALEISNFGRIRYAGTHTFFGQCSYLEDLPGLVSGKIGVWNSDSVVMTDSPRTYFKKRSRTEIADEDDFLHAEAA